MSYCVFMHRADSIYDDSPAEQYQFPTMYLERAQGCVGDWIVYLEPTKIPGTRGYFAIARVQEIIPDPKVAGMYLALIEPGSYLDFARFVPFRDVDGLSERRLLKKGGKLSGRAQWAVRPISPDDFQRIVERGIDDREPVLPRIESSEPLSEGFQEEQSHFIAEQLRDRVKQLTSRVVRERVFRRVILHAYSERCAVSGLKFINGGGRAEVAAAHIRPVQHNGPDTVQNGIALSGTAHWMFDRGLISLADDLTILVSRQVNDFGSVQEFINESGRALPPSRPADRPHPHFLSWHRENCFKH